MFYFHFMGLQALRLAPTNSNDMEKNLAAMLYVNRASALHVSPEFV